MNDTQRTAMSAVKIVETPPDRSSGGRVGAEREPVPAKVPPAQPAPFRRDAEA